MVFVDLEIPFRKVITSKEKSLHVLTIIDPAIVWFGIVKATNKSVTSIQELFHKTWFAH
jgi:hypothetical protein